jgi:hypothetical protein
MALRATAADAAASALPAPPAPRRARALAPAAPAAARAAARQAGGARLRALPPRARSSARLSLRPRAALDAASTPPPDAPPLRAWSDDDQEALYDTWAGEVTPEIQAAVDSSLVKLEWPALCAQVGRFAATALGREAVLAMRLPHTRAESQARAQGARASARQRFRGSRGAALAALRPGAAGRDRGCRVARGPVLHRAGVRRRQHGAGAALGVLLGCARVARATDPKH